MPEETNKINIYCKKHFWREEKYTFFCTISCSHLHAVVALLSFFLGLIPGLNLGSEEDEVECCSREVDARGQEEDGSPRGESLVALGDGPDHGGHEEVGGAAGERVADAKQRAREVGGEVHMAYLDKLLT